ncbi:hypothetical protein D1872_354170 [compost metagenome]
MLVVFRDFLDDVFKNGNVFAQQINPGFTRFLGGAGGHNNDICIAAIFIGSCPELHTTDKWHAMVHI